MADDRMKNDDLDRNLGGSKQNLGNQQKYGQGQGQKSPGRSQQDDPKFGQKRSQGTSRHDIEKDDMDSQHGSRADKTGKQGGMSGQNR